VIERPPLTASYQARDTNFEHEKLRRERARAPSDLK
jgi:hypothetical protein